jgi:hypothetical protein
MATELDPDDPVIRFEQLMRQVSDLCITGTLETLDEAQAKLDGAEALLATFPNSEKDGQRIEFRLQQIENLRISLRRRRNAKGGFQSIPYRYTRPQV